MIHHLRLADVNVGPRMRGLFNEERLLELADSIKEFGLLQPILVTEAKGLIAGHRRLLAFTALHNQGIEVPGCPPGTIPAIILSADEVRAKELELEENLRRQDLTWKEVVRGTAELHKLKQAQDPSWTATKTAQVSGKGNATSVLDRVALATHLSHPDIAKAESEAEAIRRLKKKLELDFRAVQVARGESATPVGIVLECLDGEVGIETRIAPGTVDVILTDPPYGVNAGDLNFSNVSVAHTYKDDWESAALTLARVLRAATQVCKPQAHCYIFCSLNRFWFISELLENLGWEPWPRPLIWAKTTGLPMDALRGPLYSYETICYAARGRKEVVISKSDVLTYSPPKDKTHGAQKPVELILDLLSRSALPGDTILDPFCGSGVVAKAAARINCNAYCFDIDHEAILLAREGFTT